MRSPTAQPASRGIAGLGALSLLLDETIHPRGMSYREQVGSTQADTSIPGKVSAAVDALLLCLEAVCGGMGVGWGTVGFSWLWAGRVCCVSALFGPGPGCPA